MTNSIIQSPNVSFRKTPTCKLVFFTILSLGVYWYIWLWKLITDINNLYPFKGKCIHRYNWFCSLIGLQIISITMTLKNIQTEFIINIAGLLWIIINLLLTLQILKNIERFVKRAFDININHSVLGWVFFGSFYVNFKINRLNKAIKKGISNKIEKIKLEEQSW